jgi:hypothetical protein
VTSCAVSAAFNWSRTLEVRTPEPSPSELIVPAIGNPFIAKNEYKLYRLKE